VDEGSMTDAESGQCRTSAQDDFADLQRVVRFFAQLIGLGLAGAVAYAASLVGWHFWGVVLWSLALLACGAGLGFLFGIPKVLQDAPTAPPPSSAPTTTGGSSKPALLYRQKVNTNLEEISDWLTKIIVGVTLVQLKTVPDQLWRLALVISASLGTSVSAGFGLALILFFTTSGFLFGYLVTRLYLQGALARADRDVERQGIAAEKELREKSTQAELEVKQALDSTPAARRMAPVGSGAIDDELRALADQYVGINVPDYSERLRQKNDLAARLAAHVIERGVSRDLLCRETHEGLLLALAAAAHFSPEAGDTQRLIGAAAHANRWHVQYRFVIAFARLFERGMVSDTDKVAIEQVLKRFERNADASLKRAIAGLRRQLER
jgi:hypothetical protein